MALNVHGLACGTIQDVLAYGSFTGSPTCNGTGDITIPLTSNLQLTGYTDAPTLQTYRRLFGQVKVPDWAGAAGSTVGIADLGGGTRLSASYVDAGGFNVQLRDVNGPIATGTTKYAFATTFYYFVATNGISTSIEFGNPMTLQINVAETRQITDAVLFSSNSGVTGSFIFTGPQMVVSYDTDIWPDPTTLEYRKLYPGGTQAVLYNEWPTVVPGLGTKADEVDDWNTNTHDSDSTYVASSTGANGDQRQTYDTVDPTAFTKTIRVVAVFSAVRADIANKAINGRHVIADGTVSVQSSAVSLAFTNYGVMRSIHFTTAPDGTTWDATDINNLEIGQRVSTGPDAVNCRCTATQAEAVAFETRASPIPKMKVVELDQAVPLSNTW